MSVEQSVNRKQPYIFLVRRKRIALYNPLPSILTHFISPGGHLAHFNVKDPQNSLFLFNGKINSIITLKLFFVPFERCDPWGEKLPVS